MKKILIVCFALLLLAGCSDKAHYSYLSDGDEVLFEGPNTTYTKNDLYKSLKVSGSEIIASDILDKIAMDIDSINMEELESQADELIEMYTAMGYESYIIASYGSLEAYRNSYLSSLLLNELAKEYVRDDYDHFIEEKKPVKMQLAVFTTIEDAEKCIEDVKNGSTFDTAAVNNNSSASPETGIYTDDDTSLIYEIKEYLNSNDQTGISPVITYTVPSTDAEGNAVDSNTYYVVNVESRNADDFKDEAIDRMAYDVTSDDVRDYFLSKHDIEFFDQDLYKVMTSAFEVLN